MGREVTGLQVMDKKPITSSNGSLSDAFHHVGLSTNWRGDAHPFYNLQWSTMSVFWSKPTLCCVSLTSVSRLNRRGSGLHGVGFLTDVMFNVTLVNVGSGPDDKGLPEPT